MIKVKQTEMLPAVLSLLVESWKTTLQDSDVTSFVLSLVVRLITSSTKLPESTIVLEKYFALISQVGCDEEQRGVLCRAGHGQDQEECFLLCLPILINRFHFNFSHTRSICKNTLSSPPHQYNQYY